MSDREGSLSRSLTPSESSHKSASAKRSNSRKQSRSPSKSPRNRSRSRSHHRRYSRSRSRSRHRDTRSRSRSYDNRRSSRYDRSDRYDHSARSSRQYSGSRSPMSSRRRHQGDRDRPRKSRCLGVFGLSLRTQDRDLQEIFEKYGPIDDVQIVYDHQTGRSRGFGFVYMKYVEDAMEAKEKASGMQLDGRNIRIDFSITERAHTPTPGVYLGRTSGATYHGRRSSSPGRRGGRYSRSRSRSNSRRRY